MKEYKEKNEKDLKGLLNEKRVALRSFRFDIAGSRAKDIKTGKNLKKEVARILTELSSRKAIVK